MDTCCNIPRKGYVGRNQCRRKVIPNVVIMDSDAQLSVLHNCFSELQNLKYIRSTVYTVHTRLFAYWIKRHHSCSYIGKKWTRIWGHVFHSIFSKHSALKKKCFKLHVARQKSLIHNAFDDEASNRLNCLTCDTKVKSVCYVKLGYFSQSHLNS